MCSFGNNVFSKTKSIIFEIIKNNLDKDADSLWQIVLERFPGAPDYILRSCLEEIINNESSEIDS